MKIRPTKTLASFVLVSIITSNSLFIYANDIQASYNCEISLENNKNSSLIKLNRIQPNKTSKRQLPYVFNAKSFESDDYEVLHLLNTTYKGYKHQLQKGETLQSILEKNNSSDNYKVLKYIEYEQILQNAVTNNTLTQTEKDNLLCDYIKTLTVL